jgi:phosphate transport system substrate-binding protein
MLGRLLMVGACALALAGCGNGGASREQIKIVGSSTVYPFTTAVAESFVNANPSMKPPVVESTGSGAGFKLFCGGVGPEHPDINDASRRMTKSEYALCSKNGVDGILEVPIGADGIVLAQSKNGPPMVLTQQDLYKALAANPGGKPNTAKSWRDVNPNLPAIPIQVYGPPSTSGTRDAFSELILGQGCKKSDPDAAKIETSDPTAFADRCTRIRDDGPYIDSGENDNLIVQKLAGNANAIGIFGYSYLEENQDRIRAVPVNGIEPSYNSILAGSYPGSRPLFLYVKKQHLHAVRGLQQFLGAYEGMWAKDGPLMKRGLIALSPQQQQHSSDIIDRGIVLDPAELH